MGVCEPWFRDVYLPARILRRGGWRFLRAGGFTPPTTPTTTMGDWKAVGRVSCLDGRWLVARAPHTPLDRPVYFTSYAWALPSPPTPPHHRLDCADGLNRLVPGTARTLPGTLDG